MFVRMRFMPRGGGREDRAGEAEGEADMRSSSPPLLPSSSALRLRPDMADEGERTAERLLSVAAKGCVCWAGHELFRVGECRLNTWGGGVEKWTAFMLAVSRSRRRSSATKACREGEAAEAARRIGDQCWDASVCESERERVCVCCVAAESGEDKKMLADTAAGARPITSHVTTHHLCPSTWSG